MGAVMGSYTDDADNFGAQGQYYSGGEPGIIEAILILLGIGW